MKRSPPADRHAWEDAFIAGLRAYGMGSRAAQAAGVSDATPYAQRKRSAAFRQRWDQTLADYRARRPAKLRNRADKPAPRQWQRTFLEALSETSNVSASAKRAHVPPREAYRLRRCDSDFAEAWRAALFEGYANLEMEVLGYLRDPAPKHRMDVASALRLLAAHKDTIAGERATRANVSAAEVRASIERKVEIFRRQIANRREPDANEH